LATCRDRHVAANEKGESAEHLRLGEARLAADQLANAIRELIVIGHPGDCMW
jgi:hypothetical protein